MHACIHGRAPGDGINATHSPGRPHRRGSVRVRRPSMAGPTVVVVPSSHLEVLPVRVRGVQQRVCAASASASVFGAPSPGQRRTRSRRARASVAALLHRREDGAIDAGSVCLTYTHTRTTATVRSSQARRLSASAASAQQK